MVSKTRKKKDIFELYFLAFELLKNSVFILLCHFLSGYGQIMTSIIVGIQAIFVVKMLTIRPYVDFQLDFYHKVREIFFLVMVIGYLFLNNLIIWFDESTRYILVGNFLIIVTTLYMAYGIKNSLFATFRNFRRMIGEEVDKRKRKKYIKEKNMDARYIDISFVDVNNLDRSTMNLKEAEILEE